jgi:hypothetical protein
MQPSILVLDGAQESKNLAGTRDIGVCFAVDDLLDRLSFV